MDHSELIKAEASKLADLHFCPEIKANLASKEAGAGYGALYGGLGGAGIGGLAGGIHGYFKRRGSMRDALKQSLVGALLGGGVGAVGGGLYGAGADTLDSVAKSINADGPNASSPAPVVTDPDSFAARYPALHAAASDAWDKGTAGAGVGAAFGGGAAQLDLSRSHSGGSAISKLKRLHNPSRSFAIPPTVRDKITKVFGDLPTGSYPGLLEARRAKAVEKVKDILENNLSKRALNKLPKNKGTLHVANRLAGNIPEGRYKNLDSWMNQHLEFGKGRISPGSLKNPPKPFLSAGRLKRTAKGLGLGGGIGAGVGILKDYLKSDQVPRR